MNQTELLTLLNNAGQNELIELPGVGHVLAERIIAARPYNSLDAVRDVKGVGANMLERMMAVPVPQPDLEPAFDHQQDSPAPEADADKSTAQFASEGVKETVVDKGQTLGETLPEADADKSTAQSTLDDVKEAIIEKGQALGETLTGLGESVRKQGQAARQAVEALPEKFERTSRSRGPLWTILVSSAITALVAILLTLAVLGGVNGSLKFATGSQYSTMQREADQLGAQVNTLQQDLDGLRGRVNTLEGFGERTVALEKSQEQLAADVNTASQHVTDMQSELTALNEKVTQQEVRTQRFETFLKDLQTMLGNLFAP